jgi:hypothetical protein
MAISAGDSNCTNGLSGAIYSQWLADAAAGLSPLPAAVIIAKAMCYRWAIAIATAHNADSGGLGSLTEATVAPPAAGSANVGSFYLYRPGSGQPSQLLLCEQTSVNGVYEWAIVNQSS